MEPTFMPGDRLLVWRGLRSRRPPAGGAATSRGRPVKVVPGQLIVARHPKQPGLLIVKRLAWHEAGGWWVTADNPAAGGADSFRFGPVPPELIAGRVLCRYKPAVRRRT